MGRIGNRYDLGTFTANGQSLMKRSNPFRNAGFTLIASGSFDGTVKFLASNADSITDAPDLSQAASDTNEYETNAIVPKKTGGIVSGDTGVAFTGVQDGVSRYMLNDNNNNWVGVKISGVTTGQVIVRLDFTDNQ